MRLPRVLTDPFTALLCRLGLHTPTWTTQTDGYYPETRWLQVRRCTHCNQPIPTKAGNR